MYDQIIVPLDGSARAARALRPGRALATACRSPLLVLSCVPRGEAGKRRRAVLQDQLQDQLGVASAEEVEVRVVSTSGTVAHAIAQVLDDDPGSLVVMATPGHPHTEPVVGSVSEELLRVASQPVLLVGPEVDVSAFELRGVLVVAVDGSRTSETAVPLAGAWATAFDLQPWVVSVLDPRDGPPRPAEDGLEPPIESAYVHRVANQLSEATGHEVEFEVLHSLRPATALTADARDRKAAVICVSTHGRTGARRLAMGSTAMSIVRHAPCPVLVNRPPTFPHS